MKKVILGIISIILILGVILCGMFLVDKNRMKNNKPVIFSTWGYSYAPPINLDEDKIKEALCEYILKRNENTEKKQNEKWFVALRLYLIDEVDDTQIITYAWLLEESYYNKDGVAIKDSASSIPYKFILKNSNGKLEVESCEFPRDGYYAEDMEKLFPSDVNKQMEQVYEDGTINELESDIQRQVSKYFNTENFTTSYNSFVGTVLEETTTYMIVEPNEDEIERKTADKIRINYGTDNVDYLYGVGRKVVISYTGAIMETYPAQINTNDISADGYSDFEILVENSNSKEAKKILNNKDLYKNNSDYNLYYYGLNKVNVKVDGKIISLEEALKSGKVTLEKIISNANSDFENEKISGGMYKDGGSMMYEYDNYVIFKFHSLDGNRDMYICNKQVNINELY